MKKTKLLILTVFLSMAWGVPLSAQWSLTESVLNTHTWYKVGVVEEGIYALDGTALQSLGVDLQQLNPARIRLYGNEQQMLPESNSAERYDDLSELAIQVLGGEDGHFDVDDKILFYGQGPVNMTWNASGYYDYQRNSYSDTVFYFLCVDGGQPGLRMTEKPVVPTTGEIPTVTR